MEISDRLVQVKNSTKVEKDFLTYTPSEIVFLFGDVIRPVGLILNHNDPSECFVLFHTVTPMDEIYSFSENPSWVGVHIHLLIKKPHPNIFPIVFILLADNAPEEGEEYEYIPSNLLIPEVLEVLGSILLQKEERNLLPPVALQQEMKSRQDASLGPAHDVSSVLQTLLMKGALRTNIPKLSAFSGERAKVGCHLSSGVMSSKPSRSLTVILH